MICVLSHQNASEADRVIHALRACGADVIRVNTGEGESHVGLTLGLEERDALVSCDGRSVRAQDISSVWLHQLPPRREAGESKLPSAAALSSRLRMWHAFSRCIDESCWVNPPWRVEEAANKYMQLIAAKEVGLAIPRTIMGNLASEIQKLDGQPVVAKYLGDPGALWSVGTGFTALTTRIEISDLGHETIRTPLLYQRHVDSVREYRIVMIDAEQYVAGCEKPEGITDIRDAESLPAYEPAEAPSEVISSLRLLLARLGLKYCSSDFIVDEDDNWYFIDLNATGAYWWVDDLFDRQITRAIRDTLIRGI